MKLHPDFLTGALPYNFLNHIALFTGFMYSSVFKIDGMCEIISGYRKQDKGYGLFGG
jgi:hypothetical protein